MILDDLVITFWVNFPICHWLSPEIRKKTRPFWGWFPLLAMIPRARSQWDHHILPITTLKVMLQWSSSCELKGKTLQHWWYREASALFHTATYHWMDLEKYRNATHEEVSTEIARTIDVLLFMQRTCCWFWTCVNWSLQSTLAMTRSLGECAESGWVAWQHPLGQSPPFSPHCVTLRYHGGFIAWYSNFKREQMGKWWLIQWI